jgi:hypothetical protein
MIEARPAKLRVLLAPGTRDDDDITLLSELLSLPSSAADLPQPAAQTRRFPRSAGARRPKS